MKLRPVVRMCEVCWFLLTCGVALSAPFVQGCFYVDPTVTVQKVEVDIPAICTKLVELPQADGSVLYAPESVECGDAGQE